MTKSQSNITISAVVVYFLLALFFTSCGPNYVYENNQECSEYGWFFQDSLQLDFEVKDSNTIYNLHLIIEHSTSFSFQNFYTRIHTVFPEGQRISEQVSLELAGKGGIWLGDCSGSSCTLDIPIQQGVFFSQVGQYQLIIEQFSRQDPLKNIQSIHLALEETREKR